MDAQAIKQRILSGEMSDAEFSNIIKNVPHTRKQSGSFLKTILKGYIQGYTAPNMYRATLEALLILLVIVGIVILAYTGRIDSTISSVLMAFVLGFLFGKLK